MNYLKSYCENIIKPIEDMKDEVEKKYYSSILFKKKYKKLLDKLDDELFNKYQKLETMIDEEIQLLVFK